MAMAVEVKVYRERHMHDAEDRGPAEKEFDAEESNPMHSSEDDAEAPAAGSELAAAHQASERVLSVGGLDFGD